MDEIEVLEDTQCPQCGGEGEEAEEADLERPHEQPTRKVLSARALGLYGP